MFGVLGVNTNSTHRHGVVGLRDQMLSKSCFGWDIGLLVLLIDNSSPVTISSTSLDASISTSPDTIINDGSSHVILSIAAHLILYKYK